MPLGIASVAAGIALAYAGLADMRLQDVVRKLLGRPVAGAGHVPTEGEASGPTAGIGGLLDPRVLTSGPGAGRDQSGATRNDPDYRGSKPPVGQLHVTPNGGTKRVVPDGTTPKDWTTVLFPPIGG